jgi:DNA adenine methylase
MNQMGNYKIDARFNRKGLTERISRIASYADRIEVTNEDGMQVIRQYASETKTLIYADPPYFEKAGSLYMNAFEQRDHQLLAECLNSLSKSKWLLTYDNVPQVGELYAGRRREIFALNYSAHRVTKANEVMVFSDGLSNTLHRDLEKR